MDNLVDIGLMALIGGGVLFFGFYITYGVTQLINLFWDVINGLVEGLISDGNFWFAFFCASLFTGWMIKGLA